MSQRGWILRPGIPPLRGGDPGAPLPPLPPGEGRGGTQRPQCRWPPASGGMKQRGWGDGGSEEEFYKCPRSGCLGRSWVPAGAARGQCQPRGGGDGAGGSLWAVVLGPPAAPAHTRAASFQNQAGGAPALGHEDP